MWSIKRFLIDGKATCLLDFSCRGSEQLDIPGADTFPVLGESFRRVRFIGKEYKGVAGGSAIGLPHEQDPVGAVQHGTGVFSGSEEVQLKKFVHCVLKPLFHIVLFEKLCFNNISAINKKKYKWRLNQSNYVQLQWFLSINNKKKH